MIGIRDIAVYVPGNVIDNIQQGISFGEDRSFIEGKIGALQLPRRDELEETSDMAVSAVMNLVGKNPTLNFDLIDALIVITQNGDNQGLPHTAAIVHRKLQLPLSVAAFDISLGCSGYVHGLYILKGFLEASGLSSGILITADPYSKIVDETDRVTALLFGDAATATWLDINPVWRLGKVLYGSDGKGTEALENRAGRLYMNGRAVFNFAAIKVAPHITKLLTVANLHAEQIDAFCLHQGSKSIIEAIAKHFPTISDRFLLDMRKTGNTVSSSIPILLEKYILGSEYDTVVLSGFGVGFSWASALIHKNLHENTK